MRPGLRFRRVWTFAEAAGLGSALAETIRSEFDAVFAPAHEPMLSSAEVVRLEARDGGSAPGASSHSNGFVREAIPERVRHEVWRRDQGRCVDCGSRERLEFDHIIPISKGGSNTARNIELRCEACNRRKSASV
jgi:HNH endonuclease